MTDPSRAALADELPKIDAELSLVDRLRTRSRAVFLAAEAGPAKDLSNHLKEAADEIDRLRALPGRLDCGAVPSESDLVACMDDNWGLITQGLTRHDFFAACAVTIQDLIRRRVRHRAVEGGADELSEWKQAASVEAGLRREFLARAERAEDALRKIADYSPASTIQPVAIAREALTALSHPNTGDGK